MRTLTCGVLVALGLATATHAAPVLKAEAGVEATVYAKDGAQGQSVTQGSLRCWAKLVGTGTADGTASH